MRAALGDALDATRAAQVRAAARALLVSPLLRPGGRRRETEGFALVRRHERELRDWFDRATGWRLVVTPEVARLAAVPPDPDDATHPLTEQRAGGRPFTRRRYVVLCLCLAALERADTQVTLGRLAEQVVLLAADPELVGTGLVFRLESRDERLDLVAVVRRLLSWGVLSRVAGAEESFVAAEGDALYDVDRRALSLALVAPGDGSADAAAATTGASAGDVLSEEARTRALRHRLTRLLLCLPVVYLSDLTAEEVAYLSGQRSALTGRITALTGLVAEVRAEGVAMVDPDDELTDVRMPESGTDGHLALLLAEHLAGADLERPGTAVPLEVLRARTRALVVEHRSHWRGDVSAAGAEVELVEAAVDRLAALRLVRRVGGGTGDDPGGGLGDDAGDDPGGLGGGLEGAVAALPALHRYAVTAPVLRGAASTGVTSR